MKEKVKQEKAITLITLVITIIVLLILAGISIATLTGENGIFEKVSKAREEAKKAEYKELLEIIGNGLQPEKIIEQLSNKDYMDRYEEEIKKDSTFKQAVLTRKDNETIQVITKEGYVYIITADKVEYIGKQGENPPPDLQKSDIEFNLTPSGWTKNEVSVEIISKIEGYKVQYSTDGTTWTNYTKALTMNDNGAIYARLINNLDEAGGYATGNVENIDRLAPNQFKPTTTTTTNSITLTGSTTDAEKTEIDASSGVEKYYFSKDDGATWEPTEGQTETSYTFTGLIQNQTYNFKMKAVDKVGNEIITNTVSETTTGVPGLTNSNTTFSYNPSTWTKGSVAVTITTTAGSKYTLQYSTDGTNWTNYTTPVTMNSNGFIYARVKDSTGQVNTNYATGNVTVIDKTGPTVSISSGSITTNSAKLTVTASDAQSGLATSETYQYYLGTSLKSTSTTNNYTFTGLTAGTSYTLKVVVTDNLGNTTEESTTITTTKTVANLQEGEYVNYIDKNGTTRASIVLYNNSSYGVQIITVDTVEDVKLGNNEVGEGVMSGWSYDETAFDAARTSYNNAINTLNTRANAYLNTTYASSARSVGSVPNSPNSEAGYYTRNDSWFASYNNTLKNMDTNYETDCNQMEKLSIKGTDKEYWLASRYINFLLVSGSTPCVEFCVRCTYRYIPSYTKLCELMDNFIFPKESVNNTKALRPVFTLKPAIKITGGSGTSSSPYTLGT